MIKVENKDGFYIFTKNGIEIYDVSHEKCNTERLINETIAILAEKSWWNLEIENEFIRLWKIENKYE